MEPIQKMENQISKSPENGIIPSSTDLIRSQNSVRLNAAESVGRIFDKFRMAQGWRSDEDQENHEARILSWIEILGTARIEVRHYEDLYRRAMVNRGLRKATGESLSYWVTPEELIAEHAGLLRD